MKVRLVKRSGGSWAKSPSSRAGRVLHAAFSSPIIERLQVIKTEMGQKIRTYMALLHKIVDTSGIC